LVRTGSLSDNIDRDGMSADLRFIRGEMRIPVEPHGKLRFEVIRFRPKTFRQRRVDEFGDRHWMCENN
jgi:hypothetical protein